MTLSLSQKEELLKRCLAFIKECPKDIKANQPFWDKEVDYLITQLYLHLKEEIDVEKGSTTKENRRIPK
jgi:hypothetical protein